MGKDGVHPNLSSAEIDDTIELLNIELDCRHLQVNIAIIPIVVISREAPTTGSIAAAQQKLTTRSSKATRRKEEDIPK